MAAHDFADKGGLHLVPQLIHRLKDQAEDAVQPLLLGPQQLAAAQVLPEQHTEHGGGFGVFQALGSEVDLGGGGVGGKKQLPVGAVPPQGEHHQFPSRLADFINPGSGQGADFLGNFVEKSSVKGHSGSSFLLTHFNADKVYPFTAFKSTFCAGLRFFFS